MFSTIVALIASLLFSFAPNNSGADYANDIPANSEDAIVLPANFDLTNPYSLMDVYVDDLSYGEFEIAADNCDYMNAGDDIAFDECLFGLAMSYPDFGHAYYSDLTARMGGVDDYANEFFTYYDLNERNM